MADLPATLNAHIPDLDRMSEADREAFMRVFMAGVGAAAAMQTEIPVDVNIKEYYGTAPTDLRREFSSLPRPAQGGDGGRYQQRKGNGA